MNDVTAVLLDLGHTLVDYDIDGGALLPSYRDVHDYLARLALGPQPVQDDLMLQVTNHAFDQIVASYERGELEELDMLTLFDEALRHHGWHLTPELVQEVLRREHAAYARHLLVPEPTLATLRELRQRGYALGIVSNATLPGPLMRDDLELHGLSGLVDAAAFSSEVGVRKPHRRIFETVLDALAVDPRHCLFVGDRLKEDVGGSRALGMRAVLTHEFRREEPPVDARVPVIQRFSEVLPMVADGPFPS